MIKLLSRKPTALRLVNPSAAKIKIRSEERFSRNAETDLVCRLLLEKKKMLPIAFHAESADSAVDEMTKLRNKAVRRVRIRLRLGNCMISNMVVRSCGSSRYGVRETVSMYRLGQIGIMLALHCGAPK